MVRTVRRLVLGLILSIGLGLAVLFGLSEYELRRTWPTAPETVAVAGPGAVARGRRLAKLYGCTSCHGADYRGLEYNEDPSLVRNHAPNLTLLASRYDNAQLSQAIRQGISPVDGRALWGMPSPTFRTLTDAEMATVLAHLRSLPVAGPATPQDSPGWQGRLALLRGLFLAPKVASSDPRRAGVQQSAPVLIQAARRKPPLDLGPPQAAGRHWAMTVCSECHGSDLGGDAVEGGPDLAIVGAYDRTAFRHLMRTGLPPGGRDLGLMSQTAREDLKVFTDGEIDALYAYLKARADNLSQAPAP